MKKDQANKTNVERVYRWQPLAWEPGPNRSGIDLWLVQEWVQCSLHKLHKYASELEWSGGRWSRVEADGVGGGQGWAEKGKGGCTMTVTYIIAHIPFSKDLEVYMMYPAFLSLFGCCGSLSGVEA